MRKNNLLSVIIAVVENDKKYLSDCIRSIHESIIKTNFIEEYIIIANSTHIKRGSLSNNRSTINANYEIIGINK